MKKTEDLDNYIEMLIELEKEILKDIQKLKKLNIRFRSEQTKTN